MTPHTLVRLGLVATLGLGLSACVQHVTQEELDASVSEVQAAVDSQGERIEENARAIKELRREQNKLQRALEQLRQDLDARIKKLEDRLVLSLPVHFEFDRAEIRPVDEPILDRFAATMREHLSGGVVTVEGFADAAGSESYNRRLAAERAEAVRTYLVDEAGLPGDRVRAVGLGERRLINQETGAGRSGIENRRVTFVIEYSGEVGS